MFPQMLVPFMLYFYPRPPRGGRLSFRRSCIRRKVISIHALREEGDFTKMGRCPQNGKFLSTPSARRATSERFAKLTAQKISIHALREEGDRCVQLLNQRIEVISIHALREEGDHWPSKTLASMRLFLSTPSARRATRFRL